MAKRLQGFGVEVSGDQLFELGRDVVEGGGCGDIHDAGSRVLLELLFGCGYLSRYDLETRECCQGSTRLVFGMEVQENIKMRELRELLYWKSWERTF